MIKVTLNDNLVRYQGDLPVTSSDLTGNLFLAKSLVRSAVQFFHFDSERIRFSGYVDESPGEFRIEVWYKDELYRVAKFPKLQHQGILKCEVMFGKIELAVKFDLVGGLYGALGQASGEVELV